MTSSRSPWSSTPAMATPPGRRKPFTVALSRSRASEAHLVPVNGPHAPWDLLENCDAIIFGAPTYMAEQSAQFKAFQDATSRAVFAAGGKWQDKIAAGFTNSASRSGDKLAVLQQFALFAAQHGMHWVNLGLPPGKNSATGSEQDLNRLGFFMGAGAQSNADEGPDVAPPTADLLTAEHLGRRVAAVALQFARGRMVAPELPRLTFFFDFTSQ